MDRELVGVVVRREINRQFGSVSAFVSAAAGVSRRTVERVMRGDATIQYANLERIEGALGLPRDALAMIGQHELDELEDMGVERDLVRWVRRRLDPPAPLSGAG